MRISDWSSDVCSSDLGVAIGFIVVRAAEQREGQGGEKENSPHDAMNARSRRRGQPRSRLQLDAPIQPVAPGFVQVIGREAAAMFLELPARRPDRRDVERHPRLFGRSEEHTSELQSLMRNSYA